MTSDDGIFYVACADSGFRYNLKVTRRGYADWELPSFDLSVGETLNFRIPLYADKALHAHRCAARAVAGAGHKTSVAALVTEDQLADLPTKGRCWKIWYCWRPPWCKALTGIWFSAAKGLPNVFLLDGIDITDEFFLHHPGAGPTAMQESMSEMQVISAAAPADFGRAMGGMLNMISRTGTNGLHAAAYDYYSQNSWDSPDFFGNGFVPTGRDNHAGVSVGLPISSDRSSCSATWSG